MPDIIVDNGNNAWIDSDGNNFILIPGKELFSKHGEGKSSAGGEIKGWNSIPSVYKFIKSLRLQMKPGFQSVPVSRSENNDTVASLSPAEVAELKSSDLGIADKMKFNIPGLPPEKAPILRSTHQKGKSTPASEFQVLMFPTTSADLDKDSDLSVGYEGAKEQAARLEQEGKKLWIVLTTYPGKPAAPGDRPGKERWLHPTAAGTIEGNLAFTEDSVPRVEPWPTTVTESRTDKTDPWGTAVPEQKEAMDWVGISLSA